MDKTLVTTAAIAEATRLCDQAFSAMRSPQTRPDVRARAKRYQVEHFRNQALSNRVVCDLLRGDDGIIGGTREEFLAAVDLYCAAGIAEVERRFAA